MMRLVVFSLLLGCVAAPAQDKKPLSGPQPGEKLPALPMKGVFDKHAGKELDIVTKADGKPVVLVFVHSIDRPSMHLTRNLLDYAVTRAKDGVHSGLVWLSDDATETENQLKRMKQALPKDVPVGIANGGKEGPGSYGLNRNVTLTVLIAKDNKVTANFALVQPSTQADLPKILDELCKVAGGKAPKLEDLPGMKAKSDARPATDEKLTGLLRALIKKDATKEQVDKKAEEIVAYIKSNEAARKEIARISTTLVNGGKLTDYGTPRAQEKLKAWAKEYGPKTDKPKP